MQNPNTNQDEKVVNLFAKRQPAAEKSEDKDEAAESAKFLDSMRKNAENADRLRRERLKANHSVLKSYRIKN